MNDMARALHDGRPMTCFDCGNASAIDDHVAAARAAVARTERINDLLARAHERYVERVIAREPSCNR